MRSHVGTTVLTVMVVSICSTLAFAEDFATSDSHASPERVFQALRDAQSKADWHTLFRCQSPEAQRSSVFEAYYLCNLHLLKAGVVDILKKHGVTSDVVDAAYHEAYQRKHGVDLAQRQAEYETKRQKLVAEYFAKNGIDRSGNRAVPVPDFSSELPKLPPVDPVLYREVVMSRIQDSQGFYTDVNDHLVARETIPTYGALTDVAVRGDSATGRTTTTIFHYSAAPGTPPMRVPTVVPQTVEFKRINGGWYLHTIR